MTKVTHRITPSLYTQEFAAQAQRASRSPATATRICWEESYDHRDGRIARRTSTERVRTRFYGKYRGIVRDIDDPESLCRIKAEVPAIYDDQASPWAMPALPFAGPSHGLVLLPEVGDGVWIEFEAGDISRPIWTGCWLAAGERPGAAGRPRRALLATSAGHKIVLDEDADEIQTPASRRRASSR